MAKQTITEQLMQAKQEISTKDSLIESLKEQLTKAQKETEQYKGYYIQSNKDNDKLKAEIEQVHQLLDTVPNSINRKSDHEESYNRVERNLTTRLAAWLCVR